MDSLASGLFFFLSIPVGIMGAAFLLVWALKALKQKVKKWDLTQFVSDDYFGAKWATALSL